MMETSRTTFVKQYKPGNQARVELVNGRIVDAVNGRLYEAGTSIILQAVAVGLPGSCKKKV